MKREVVVNSVAFSDDGVDLQFLVLPDDVRSQGHVVFSRTAAVSYEAPAGLGAAAVDLRTHVLALVSQLLELDGQLEVFEPPAAEQLTFGHDDDEDEDVGMGQGR